MSLTRSARSPRDENDKPASRTPEAGGDEGLFNLDPQLHPATLHSVAHEPSNPLTDFAQHVLDDPRSGELLSFSGEDNNLFTAAGNPRFGDLDDAPASAGGAAGAHPGRGAERQQGDGDAQQQHAQGHNGQDNGGSGSGEYHPAFESPHVSPTDAEGASDEPVKMGRLVGRTKRRRDGEEIIVGPVENGEPIDPIKMKKDNHKEVERRRRENINDGINEIARLIPGISDKVGKGMLLRRAAQYLQEVTARVTEFDVTLAAKDREKQAVEEELEDMRRRLEEEHARSIRFETSWREAEDRAATQLFELDRLKNEIDELKKAAK